MGIRPHDFSKIMQHALLLPGCLERPTSHHCGSAQHAQEIGLQSSPWVRQVTPHSVTGLGEGDLHIPPAQKEKGQALAGESPRLNLELSE